MAYGAQNSRDAQNRQVTSLKALWDRAYTGRCRRDSSKTPHQSVFKTEI